MISFDHQGRTPNQVEFSARMCLWSAIGLAVTLLAALLTG